MFAVRVAARLLVVFILFASLEQTKAKIYRAHACEGHHLKLSCYIGDVLKILDAGYGRRNATICYFFDEPQPNFQVCQSPFAPEIIKAYCDGHRTCTLRAKNSNFQDPCPGQVKYAEAVYTCVPKSKYGNTPTFNGKLQHHNLFN